MQINPKDELHVVDYKATSKNGEITIDAEWQIAYKRQMEIYQWLLRQNGFKVSDLGYFVYCNGKRDKKAFDAKLEFDVIIIPYRGNDAWVEETIQEAYKCLKKKKLPASSQNCEFCSYRQAAGEVETGMVQGLLAVAGDAAQAQRLAEALPWEGLRWQAYHEVDPLLRDLQQATPGPPALGLAITPDWASVVCLANRHPDIRAAAVLDGASLQQACRQLDVNLLVLDRSRLAEEELVALSRSYLQHKLPVIAGTNTR